jgi:hypothetical protein
MITPTDAARWVGTFIVLDWKHTLADGMPKTPTNSGGRALRSDETYLYLQPFSLPANAKPGDPVTRLGLKAEEEKIPLADIDTIYAAPMDGMPIEE